METPLAQLGPPNFFPLLGTNFKMNENETCFQAEFMSSKTTEIVDAPAETSGDEEEKVNDSTPDPIVGKFKMVSSEGFDDYMKALGVSMLK